MSNDSATLTRIRCIARQEEENVIHVCPLETVQCAQLAKSMNCYYVFQITYSFFKLEKIVMTLLKIHETFSSFFSTHSQVSVQTISNLGLHGRLKSPLHTHANVFISPDSTVFMQIMYSI